MWTRVLLVLVSLPLVFAVACGGDEGTITDGSGAGSGDGSGGGGGVDLPVCVDNLDCRGGEVCRDGLCREACGETDPCSGALDVCDPVLGICVGCSVSADCGGGEICLDGTCIDACRDDSDCAADAICDVASGACVVADCTDDGDCRGGETCRGGSCVPIDALVCEPDEATCNNNTVMGCSRDGTALRETPCGDDALCVEDGASASCMPFICGANEVGCANTTTAFVCDSSGTTRTELPCPNGQLCADGVCRRQVCEPDSIVCEGNTALICDETGSTQLPLDCENYPGCADTALGCACSGGDCLERVCEPGFAQCVGSGFRACDAQGLSLSAVTPCGGDEFCQAGSCVSSTCAAGETRCAGSVLLTCNAAGNAWTERECSASAAFCDDSRATAVCSPRVCTPGARGCTADRSATVVCDARGGAEVVTDCASDAYCQSGTCLAQVCEPGTRTCVDGDVHRCDLAGSAYGFERACAAGELCSAGACVSSSDECSTAADCAPPAPSCSASQVLTYYSANGRCIGGACNFGSVQRTVDCGAAGQTCNAATASCAEVSTGCTSDAGCPGRVCISGTCRDCRSTADCAGDETCSGSNVCVPLDPTGCVSNAACVALAAEYGFPGANVACDAEVGCFLHGGCNGSAASDPFEAGCPSGLVCTPIIDLAGFTGSACQGCGTDADCRGNEECVSPLLGFPSSTPYCRDPNFEGGGLPFP